MRFVFSKTTRTIIGVNVMGMRQRHETWNKWIKEEKTIEYVMEHLQEARFDPEFFANNEKYIQKAFASYHKSIK